MSNYPRKEEGRLQLLDLIPKERGRKIPVKREGEMMSHGVSEEGKLELRLGPPDGDWTCAKNSFKRDPKDESFLPSFGCYSHGAVNESSSKALFLKLQSSTQCLSVMAKESSQPCCNKARDLQQTAGEKAFSSVNPADNTTAVPNSNTAQKRNAPSPVVGWPPVRAFRKNLASGSSSKLSSESPNAAPTKAASEKPTVDVQKGLFVKINMDGIPIGRKVNLKAHDSYEKLSSAVYELFRGLLAVQGDPSAGEIEKKGEKTITGLLDGNGEYTLVYEDNEGDRMLVGDVPWNMFVSSVKRLRVLKSSELPSLGRGNKERKL